LITDRQDIILAENTASSRRRSSGRTAAIMSVPCEVGGLLEIALTI